MRRLGLFRSASMALLGVALTISPTCGNGETTPIPPTAPSEGSAAPAPSPAPTPPVPPSAGGGIWISRDELASKPIGGPAWSNLEATASRACGVPTLADQDDPANTCTLAKAIVYARSNAASLRTDVLRSINAVVTAPPYSGRALALGRELAAYVIAADLVNLAVTDPGLDARFRSTIASLVRTKTTEAGTLIECHENRPNNWGTHCGASRVAVAAYLRDSGELDRAAKVFRGWLGDRQSYAGFKYGELDWQCDPSRPVGINPVGCIKDGHVIDGVLADDQRRAGGFTWPPPKENYVYEALQGALVQAVILKRAGYDAFSWQDAALLRAFRWLYDQAGFPASGDDTWEVPLVNAYYGTQFPTAVALKPGKNMGFTDFTHQ
jgi:hypothetical protein